MLPVEPNGKLDLDIPTNRIAGSIENVAQEIVEGDEARSDQRGEGEGPRTPTAEARVEAIRGGIVGGDQQTEGAVFLGAAEVGLDEELGLADRVRYRRRAQIDRPEPGLGILQQVGDRVERGRRLGEGRRKAPAPASVDDGPSEAERQVDDTVRRPRRPVG